MNKRELEEFTNRILELRMSHSLSQEDLGKALGIPRTAISQIEKGERGVSSSELKKLSEIFNVTADFLLGQENQTLVVLEKAPKYNKEKVQERISVPHYKVEKFKQVLLYILDSCSGKPNVGETVLYKLLYFADFNFYEIFEEQLTGATYRKLQYGPVPLEFGEIVKQMEEFGELKIEQSLYHDRLQKKYVNIAKPDLKKISAAEKKVIDDVIERFSDKSARWLSEYSHDDVPWKAAKDKEIIDYELVFYRAPAYSVRDYAEDEAEEEF